MAKSAFLSWYETSGDYSGKGTPWKKNWRHRFLTQRHSFFSTFVNTASPRWGQVRIREGQWALVARPHGRDHFDQRHLHAVQPQRREPGQYWGSCKENKACHRRLYDWKREPLDTNMHIIRHCRRNFVRTTLRSRRRSSVLQGARQRKCKRSFERRKRKHAIQRILRKRPIAHCITDHRTRGTRGNTLHHATPHHATSRNISIQKNNQKYSYFPTFT